MPDPFTEFQKQFTPYISVAFFWYILPALSIFGILYYTGVWK